MKTVKCLLLLAGIVLLCAPAVGITGAVNCSTDDGYCPPPSLAYGCTSEFWKNNTDVWPAWFSPEGFSLNERTNIIVGYAGGVITYIRSPDLNGDGIPDSHLDVLNYTGDSGIQGAQRILLRAAVGAALNGATFGDTYPATAETGLHVREAYISSDTDVMIALAEKLEQWNNATCPI